MKIAFVGNFRPEHSTESDLLKSLKILGHDVTALQEDAPVPIWPSLKGTFDIVLWAHSHGWPNGDLWRKLILDTPYVAFTLDLFRGLARHDPNYVKTHPWFTCDYFFQPDEPDWLRSQGVNAFFSAPAILETSAYLAAPDPLHPAYGKIVFVGSEAYHSEWPWRQEMLALLRNQYGDKFIHYDHSSGMRGHALNVLYSSAAVVVGDSCFASPDSRYTSDRLYESLGRGANLVYPRIKFEIEDSQAEVATYTPGDTVSLAGATELGLLRAKDGQAPFTVEKIRENHTYTHRLRAILEQVTNAKG